MARIYKNERRYDIIEGTTLAIDSTHTEANCKKQVPERIMKHLAKKLFKNLKEDHGGELPTGVETEIPNYKEIEDSAEAKRTMKAYLEKTVAESEASAGEKTKETIEEIQEILSDEKFIAQKGVRSLADKDARVGYKSKTDSFFGYKTEYTMITEERIITAIDVHSGEYVDGTECNKLLTRTEEAGVKVEALSGDKAYFKKSILDELERRKIESIIPVSACVYKVNEDLFSYNKDSDEWFCRTGNRTVRDGFEQALVIAKHHGRIEECATHEIRTRFYVRLALSMLRGPDIEQATLCLQDAWAINHRTALAALADLEGSEDEKQILLALIHTHDKTQKSCSEAACSALIYD